MFRMGFIWLFCLSLYIMAAEPVKPWFHLRPHMYLGAGAVDVLREKLPEFATENTYDQTYTALNSFKSKGLSFQSQLRLNFINTGPVSLGYIFWGHRHEYENKYPELWIRDNVLYPLRYDISHHMLCIQLDSPKTFWNGWLQPYVLGGFGPFYGSSKSAYYAQDPITGWIWLKEEETVKYDGWAWNAGAGIVIRRFFYLHVGLANMMNLDLPASRFLDIIFGVTF